NVGLLRPPLRPRARRPEYRRLLGADRHQEARVLRRVERPHRGHRLQAPEEAAAAARTRARAALGPGPTLAPPLLSELTSGPAAYPCQALSTRNSRLCGASSRGMSFLRHVGCERMRAMLDLWFESGEESLSARSAVIREGVSALFEAEVEA